jgi:hypothetical protein
LIALLKNDEKPEWWKGNHKICYRLFNKIFETTCSLEGNQEERVKRSLHVLDPNIIIPVHIKNLKINVVNMLAKHPEGSCTVILQLYKEHMSRYLLAMIVLDLELLTRYCMIFRVY